MEKGIRVRAIIIHKGKIVSMYREREDRIFYTFPGGGLEEKETEIRNREKRLMIIEKRRLTRIVELL